MKRFVTALGIFALVTLVLGCSGHKRFHQQDLGDPSEYQAHFPDMDFNGDDMVSWHEFKSHFPQTTPHVFEALDGDKDGNVDHDEWHEFKEAHGMRDH